MKKVWLCLSLLCLLSSCSYNQMAGVATGGSLGAIFGSSIGGLLGGPRGSDVGSLVGLMAGGALGAAATTEQSKEIDNERTESYSAYRAPHHYTEDIQYGYSDRPAAHRENPSVSGWAYLEVTNLRFTDSNNNRCIDAGEKAYIIMDIYNRGNAPMRNVAPQVSCDNRRITISPTAIVSVLPPGSGIRYKAALVADGRLKSGQSLFTVSFGEGREKVVAKTFPIQTAR